MENRSVFPKIPTEKNDGILSRGDIELVAAKPDEVQVEFLGLGRPASL